MGTVYTAAPAIEVNQSISFLRMQTKPHCKQVYYFSTTFLQILYQWNVENK